MQEIVACPKDNAVCGIATPQRVKGFTAGIDEQRPSAVSILRRL
jgi:hypothetical protein